MKMMLVLISFDLIDVAAFYSTMMAVDDVTSTFNNIIPTNMLLNIFFSLCFFIFFAYLHLHSTTQNVTLKDDVDQVDWTKLNG